MTELTNNQLMEVNGGKINWWKVLDVALTIALIVL